MVLVWLNGGLSHLDSWDPKPGQVGAGEFQAISTSVPSLRISELFPQLAQQMRHCTVLRSLTSAEGDHRRATLEWLTAGHRAIDGLPLGLAERIARALPRQRGVPPVVTLGANSWLSDGQPRVSERPELATEDLARYGNTTFGRDCLQARHLLQQGVRCVQLQRLGFDTHSQNLAAMRMHGSVLDPALSSLIADLHAEGMLERTLVVVLSEFGRSARINTEGGRDHCSTAFSALLAGGGWSGGHVIGESDARGEQPRQRPVTAAELHAMIHRSFGILPTKQLG